mgnify:CR=1 FL=1
MRCDSWPVGPSFHDPARDQANTSALSARWKGFVDPESGIASMEVWVGSRRDGVDDLTRRAAQRGGRGRQIAQARAAYMDFKNLNIDTPSLVMCVARGFL